MSSLWDRIQEAYYSVLPIPPAERGDLVARVCGFDPILIKEVNSLLEADESSGDFLAAPIFTLGLKVITSKNPTEVPLPAGDLLSGSTIDGRYLIEKELSHGGMGTVYLARDLTLHSRLVVIKVLLQASLQNPYVVKKFKQEVEALARIDHPGVVSVLGAGKLADEKPYIVMQFVNGVTLRAEIPGEGMNLERAGSILKQVGSALDDVHEKRIFHRDLKPENIMLQPLRNGSELVKIVDFGIAKVKDSVIAPSTANEAPVGTVLYMSPEQLRGDKVSAMSDIYSMAVIAYEMVTGRRPFNPTSGPQLLEMHHAGVRVMPVDLRSNLSTEAQAIILRGLSFKPEDRYQNASEFGEMLERALICGRPDAKASAQDMEKRLPTEPTKDLNAQTPANRRVDTVANPLDHSGVEVRSSKAGPTKPTASWTRVAILSLILVVAVAALAGVYIFRKRAQLPGITSAPSRSFNYWLSVQKMRDGRVYQEPFQSSGQEIFENGYKFRLHVSSPQPGYLYVINDGPPGADGTSLTLIYPTPARKNALVSNQQVHTNWNTFKGAAGTENLWIIWSTSQIDQLEALKAEAFNNDNGALRDINSIRSVREFLAKYSEAESTKDTAAQQTRVRGVGDVLVKRAQLEHR